MLQKGVDQEKEGMWGRTGKSRGWRSHNQDILCEKKFLFNKRRTRKFDAYMCVRVCINTYEYSLTKGE